MAHTKSMIWAGSFDRSIYVIENNPHSPEYQRLDKHQDCVIDLQLDTPSGVMYRYTHKIMITIAIIAIVIIIAITATIIMNVSLKFLKNNTLLNKNELKDRKTHK